MKKIKDYLSAGIILLSTMLSPSISESYSTPHHRHNQRIINQMGIYNLPLEYELNLPPIPKQLLINSNRIERILSEEEIREKKQVVF